MTGPTAALEETAQEHTKAMARKKPEPKQESYQVLTDFFISNPDVWKDFTHKSRQSAIAMISEHSSPNHFEDWFRNTERGVISRWLKYVDPFVDLSITLGGTVASFYGIHVLSDRDKIAINLAINLGASATSKILGDETTKAIKKQLSTLFGKSAPTWPAKIDITSIVDSLALGKLEGLTKDVEVQIPRIVLVGAKGLKGSLFKEDVPVYFAQVPSERLLCPIYLMCRKKILAVFEDIRNDHGDNEAGQVVLVAFETGVQKYLYDKSVDELKLPKIGRSCVPCHCLEWWWPVQRNGFPRLIVWLPVFPTTDGLVHAIRMEKDRKYINKMCQIHKESSKSAERVWKGRSKLSSKDYQTWPEIVKP